MEAANPTDFSTQGAAVGKNKGRKRKNDTKAQNGEEPCNEDSENEHEPEDPSSSKEHAPVADMPAPTKRVRAKRTVQPGAPKDSKDSEPTAPAPKRRRKAQEPAVEPAQAPAAASTEPEEGRGGAVDGVDKDLHASTIFRLEIYSLHLTRACG